MMKTAAMLAVLFASIPNAAGAQQAVEANPLAPQATRVVVLEGHVRSGQKAVAKADVRLVKNGTVVVNALSDAGGFYSFTNAAPESGIPPLVPPGTYGLEAQYRGTSKSFGLVVIRSGTTAHHAIDLGRIVRLGGAALPPRTTFTVTDRVAGSVPVPPPLDKAFTNERPILACQPAPDCALHYGLVRVNGPLLGPVEPAPDLAGLVASMKDVYPSASTVTIFVHGFNNNFEGPVRMTAGAAASVDTAAVPLAYSWPSKNKTLRYIDDETNNGWASQHFRDFLVALLQRSDGPATVNIIAHSMGNRVVVAALDYLAHAKPALHGRVGQVVFAAPDVDATTFWEAVPGIATAVQGLTLYSSTHDKALQLSRELHGHCRAGLTGCNDALALPPNVNAVDASFFRCDFLGHGYWASSTTMLADITTVMRNGTMSPTSPPRANLAPSGGPGRFRFVSGAADDRPCASEPST
jgi:hypothetical protein